MNQRNKRQILVLAGPTAIGKTDLSLRIARQYNCEIVSVDSMQVYKQMDIGTAKATLEERAEIQHHLIDIVEPDEDYDAASFATDALRVIKEIQNKDKIPLLTGGTGLYLRALFEGISPDIASDAEIKLHLQQRLAREGCSKLHEELTLYDSLSAQRIHKNDSHRLVRALEIFHSTGIPWSEHLRRHQLQLQRTPFADSTLQICLTCERTRLYQRINERCLSMVEAGLEGEVRALLKKGYSRDLKSFNSIGYRHMVNYIDGTWDQEEMLGLLSRDTRRYAKRQFTWFAKMADMRWFDVNAPQEILNNIHNWLTNSEK